MTNERAIELLHRLQDEQFDGEYGETRREALSMAVRTLSSQQTDTDSQGLVNDCISRQAVMKEFSDFVRKSNNSDFAPTPTWNDAVSLVGSMPSVQPQACDDAISRDDAIMAVKTGALSAATIFGRTDEGATAYYETVKAIKALPSAQSERDIPVKPIETTDKAWGIPMRQAVCPKCDYYLGHVAFLGDYKGKRVTYCETCGQAIDWEGWNFDE